MTDPRLSRRRLLAVAGTGTVAGVTGCIQRTGPLATGDCPGYDPAAATTTDWTTRMGTPAGTATVAPAAAPRRELTLDWSVPLETHVGYHTPVVADGTVYVHDMDTTLYALAADSGSQRWSRPVEGPGTPPAVGDGTVVVGTETGLSAYDASSGDHRWTAFDQSIDVFDASPVIAAGSVYYPAGVSIYALDLATGEVQWRVPTGLPSESTLAVAGDAVYAGGDDTYVRALATADGTERWRAKTDGRIRTTVSAAGGVVSTGTTAGTVWAFETDDGAERWRYALPGGSSGRGPTRPEVVATDGSRVYVTTGDELYVLAVDDGTLCWTVSGYRGSYNSGLAVCDGVLYVPVDDSDRSFAGFAVENGDATRGWESGRDLPFEMGPALADGAVYSSGHGAVGRFA